MANERLSTPLVALRDDELEAAARVAGRLLAGRPLQTSGTRPVRRRSGTGLEFLDYREYVPGDDPRAIDWLASARSRHLLLRRYHEEAAADWMILVDRSASMATGDGDKWQLGAQLAAALAYVLLALNNRVGMLLFSEELDAICSLGRGQQHYARILEVLGSHPPSLRGGGSLVGCCASVVRQGTSLVVLSDFLTVDATRSGLVSLSRIGGPMHALRIASRQDFRLPQVGPATLVDAESGAQLNVIADADLGDIARAAWDEQDAELAGLCRQRSIRLSTAWTDQGWKSALLEHMTALGERRA